jgi:transitional endoplasmic reticulum ATPase
MDGIARLSDVIIIAATNRPDLVDDALLRPGRIDSMIYVPPPDLKARKEILKIYTRKTPLADDVNLDEIAARTEGYSGADLEALVREAAMNALRRDINAECVTKEDFEKALAKIRPSITEEMKKWYETFATRRLRGVIQTPIA